MGVYPSEDAVRQAGGARPGGPRALIAAVDPGSPADDAGFAPGCYLTHVDGRPLRDVIDWRWLTDGDVIEVGYVDLDGDAGTVELEREEGEGWGFAFEGVIFDRIKLCRNACTFCFMRQLPPHMRASLSLRDDDFRLSFLSGTFVTLTNLTAEDESRILEQRISPLRVSLHAADARARRTLIGRHAQHGLDALDRLLAAGIEFHAQIVLVPDVNDGDVLRETLEWAYARPGIRGIGIVPLGFTRFQGDFDRSFNDPHAARAVLGLVEPFQTRALAERGTPWAFAADEFYRNAYGADTAERIPPTSHYGDFSMFEDGIGIIRSYVDEFAEACASGLAQRAACALDAAGARVRYVVGEAMQPFLDRMIMESPLAGRLVPLTVTNDFFGGNVDVTGLLCACDITRAIREVQETPKPETNPGVSEGGVHNIFVVPRVVLNDDGVTLDDATVEDMEKAAGVPVAVVSCNPLDYLTEIIDLANGIAEAPESGVPRVAHARP
ncbi:MAG: DUF512 domain-containing protein [Eggerthellaceae bacterium]|nr:DUF512 domain-containing protein [Eggerthellaceae bacterium]